MNYIERSADHHYTFDGATYPGVTSILKVMDKSDVLTRWASKMTAEAAIDMGPSLATLVETSGRRGAVLALSERSNWKRDEAAQQGTDIHAVADLIHRGEAIPPEAVLSERVVRYGEWWAGAGWRVRATEAFLINTADRYGGTLDLLAYDRDGRTVLADVKTGKGVYREAILQLAAYGMAEWLDQHNGRLYVMPKVDRYVVLHVTNDGVREIEVVVGEAERAAFRDCLGLHDWRDSVKARPL